MSDVAVVQRIYEAMAARDVATLFDLDIAEVHFAIDTTAMLEALR